MTNIIEKDLKIKKSLHLYSLFYKYYLFIKFQITLIFFMQIELFDSCLIIESEEIKYWKGINLKNYRKVNIPGFENWQNLKIKIYFWNNKNYIENLN